MQLTELKALMAASLLAGSVHYDERARSCVPDVTEIETAAKIAQRIWEEVIRQDERRL